MLACRSGAHAAPVQAGWPAADSGPPVDSTAHLPPATVARHIRDAIFHNCISSRRNFSLPEVMLQLQYVHAGNVTQLFKQNHVFWN